jgi:hypothetical protein
MQEHKIGALLYYVAGQYTADGKKKKKGKTNVRNQ